MDYINQFNQPINSALSPLNNPTVSAIIKLFLILYGSVIAPKLPTQVLKWFGYIPVKIVCLFLILWTWNHNPTISLLIAVSFFISMNLLSGKKIMEPFVVAGRA